MIKRVCDKCGSEIQGNEYYEVDIKAADNMHRPFITPIEICRTCAERLIVIKEDD